MHKKDNKKKQVKETRNGLVEGEEKQKETEKKRKTNRERKFEKMG